MNLLDALVIVRNCSRYSSQIHTRQGKAALNKVDLKIQSLLRKKAWRESAGAVPVHMGDDAFAYAIPEDPITKALRRLLSAEKATRQPAGAAAEIAELESAMKEAEAALASLGQPEELLKS